MMADVNGCEASDMTASVEDEAGGCKRDGSRRGRLYVFSGPSGVGKGTVLSRVLRSRKSIWQSVSATTRAPRSGEVDGKSYFFMQREDFQSKARAGEFLEWAEYAGNLYGTPRQSVEAHLDAGDDVILEIDVQGAMQIRESMPECVLVFIEPPSMDELRRRLEGRGTESADVVQARLEAAEMELSRKMEYDINLVNESIGDTVRSIFQMMDSGSGTVERSRGV